MARTRSTNKGDRAQIMARPDRLVYEIVKEECAERGIPMGQYVADVLAIHTGHPELVRELNKPKEPKEELPLAM
ncbi:MAG: toxin-antitoxin system [Mycobacterium sp.]|uniref:toxin-antitoxin system n=1 Tax=Mycolicibacterium TaxID=1866885 RepID=UPI0011DC5BE3|nr:toxin-antitoxin system [Mycolicibacterium goodii]MBU8820678.1 toxin-antitoxin system [Mycolicibacterium goodii]TXH27725.1 MAG: toxin-antitoxin system [Mycobacterium sp.]